MDDLPKDIRQFLEQIIARHSSGHRDAQFALWAATKASFLLEYRELFC